MLQTASAFVMLKIVTPSTSGSYNSPSDEKVVVLEIF